MGCLSAAPRQLSIPFNPVSLRGMISAERRISLAGLASLLLEAANVVAEESDDRERGSAVLKRKAAVYIRQSDPGASPDECRMPAAAMRAGRRRWLDLSVMDRIARMMSQQHRARLRELTARALSVLAEEGPTTTPRS